MLKRDRQKDRQCEAWYISSIRFQDTPHFSSVFIFESSALLCLYRYSKVEATVYHKTQWKFYQNS